MKQLFLLIIIFLSLFSCSSAKTLTGGISYSVDTARKIAFQGIQYKIDLNSYQQYFFDKNKDKNLKALAKHKHSFLDRWITSFSTEEYGVQYKARTDLDFYYDNNGNLTLISFTKGDNYPKKSIRYDKNGNFDSICLVVSKEEQFIFDKNKKLDAHWIGHNCYDANGELIMTRYP